MPLTNATSSGTTCPCDVAPASVANWSTFSCATAPSAQKKTMPAAAAASSREAKSSTRSDQVRAIAFQGGGDVGSAAGLGTSRRAAIQPAIARPTSTIAAGNACSQSGDECRSPSLPGTTVPSASQLPPAMPTSVAASVAIAKRPLAGESRAAGTHSGIVPITLGLSSAAWQPIKTTLPSNSQSPPGRPAKMPPDRTPQATAAAAAAAIRISANLHQTITDRFGYRSARKPASHASSTKGNTKPAVPTVSTRAT